MLVLEMSSIAAGASHSTAIDGDQQLWTWGCDVHLQLGREGSNKPGVVTGMRVCGVRGGASAWCTYVETM
jgi:alpha-tubulin suppressor-like RCC1 family protein